jgi:4-aminobutyrate aminotransferase-like enzyme
VLDVIEAEGLQENARVVGAHAKAGLSRLAEKYEWIGDVRGYGLFFGAEIVTDRATKAPAPAYVARVANEMRRRGVLLNRLGIHYNTLKIRPPMPFSIANADHLLGLLDEVLGELGAPDA